MPRRNSLAAPTAEPSSTHRRRRSTDDRLGHSNHTSKTSASRKPLNSGSSLSHPISISSDEEEDEPAHIHRKSGTTILKNSSSLLRPSSAKIPRFQQPTTPDRPRTASVREVATDIKPISYRQRHMPDYNSEPDEQEEKKEKNHETSAQLVHTSLIRAASTKLTPKEEEGHIYLCRDPKKEGLLKLGYTKDVETRGKQHENCGYHVEWIYISDKVTAMKRAEKLAKIHLRHVQKPWICGGCGKKHGEWFEIEKTKAKEVVKIWVEWINKQNPYDNDANLKPIWKYLMDYGRLSEKNLEHHDHNARWAHWTWVLSQPVPNDISRFETFSHHKKPIDSEKQTVPYQRHSCDTKDLAYRQNTTKHQKVVTAPLNLKSVMKVARAVVDERQNANITVQINNISIHF